MTRNIRKNKHFLSLLLNTTKDQGRALLYTITESQLNLINEIVSNLLHMKLTPKLKYKLKGKNKLFKQISNKSLKLSSKSRLIQRHYRQILRTLNLIKSQLEKLL